MEIDWTALLVTAWGVVIMGAPLGLVPYPVLGRPLSPLYFMVGGAVYGALMGWVEYAAARRARLASSRQENR